MTTLSIVLSYIAQIRGRLAYIVRENINLLNKMHEGLIVLSESDSSLKFASRPAVQFLKQLPLNIEQTETNALESKK